VRHGSKLAFAGLVCASFLFPGASLAAYELEAEVGFPLSSLDEERATWLLTRYSEGKILTYAPKQPRLEFLRAVIEASPEGSKTRKRAELMLQSAEASYRPEK